MNKIMFHLDSRSKSSFHILRFHANIKWTGNPVFVHNNGYVTDDIVVNLEGLQIRISLTISGTATIQFFGPTHLILV